MPSQCQIQQLLQRYPSYFTHPLSPIYSSSIIYRFPHPFSNLATRFDGRTVETRGRRMYEFVNACIKVAGVVVCSEREVVPIWAWKDTNPTRDSSGTSDSEHDMKLKMSTKEEDMLNVRWLFVGRIRYLRRTVEFEGVDRFTFDDSEDEMITKHEVMEMTRIGQSVAVDSVLAGVSGDARAVMQSRIQATRLKYSQ